MPDLKSIVVTAGVMLVSAFVILIALHILYACGLNGRCPWGG